MIRKETSIIVAAVILTVGAFTMPVSAQASRDRLEQILGLLISFGDGRLTFREGECIGRQGLWYHDTCVRGAVPDRGAACDTARHEAGRSSPAAAADHGWLPGEDGPIMNPAESGRNSGGRQAEVATGGNGSGRSIA